MLPATTIIESNILAFPASWRGVLSLLASRKTGELKQAVQSLTQLEMKTEINIHTAFVNDAIVKK